MTITWKKVHIGGGGYVLGGQMSADGTLFICKTDVFGGYVYNFTTHIWDQVIRPSKFPPQALVGQGPNKTPPADGFSEFRFAKSNLDVMYACYLSKIYKSTNRGASFVELTGYGSHTMEANNGAAHSRKATPRMDIDPINPNVVYVCTDTEGVFKTTDGGTTWGNIGLPGNANSDHPGLVCFDQTSSPIGGKTGTVYISVDGFGLYKSTDAGVTWPGSPMTGSPTKIIQLKQATNGKIAMVNHDVSIAGTTGTPYQLYKLVGTTFTEISPFLTKGAHSQQWNHNVAIDPSSPDHADPDSLKHLDGSPRRRSRLGFGDV